MVQCDGAGVLATVGQGGDADGVLARDSQPTTVSGFTTSRASRQRDQTRDSAIQKRRSG